MNKPTFKDLYYLCVQKLTNFPYIEENFDALTNYELLCKVVEELNKMITNMNTQNQSILALYNAFNTLKTYIDTYFENLDVQEEINNKLDEMSESGELTNLIKNYIDPYIEEQNDEILNFKNQINIRVDQLRSEVESIASGTPTPVNSVSEMTDTTKVYLLLTDGYIYYYDGTDWVQGWVYQSTVNQEVEQAKVDYLGTPHNTLKESIDNSFIGINNVNDLYIEKVRTNNLFNKNDITLNTAINSTGGLTTNYDYVTTGYIPVTPGTTICQSRVGNKAFYNVNKELVLFANYEQPQYQVVPENAAYFRFSVNYNDIASFRIGLGDDYNKIVIPYYESFILKNTNIRLSEEINNTVSNRNYAPVIVKNYNINIGNRFLVSLIDTNMNDYKDWAVYGIKPDNSLVELYRTSKLNEKTIIKIEEEFARVNLFCYSNENITQEITSKVLFIDLNKNELVDFVYENREDIDNIKQLNKHTTNIFQKVVCVGDSYTSGYIANSEGVAQDTYKYSYPAFMEKITGNKYVNCAVGGRNVLTWQTTNGCYNKAVETGKSQAYIIGLMINDSSNDPNRNVTLGTINDIGTQAQTYYGGMSQIIDKLIAISPNAKIFVETCPKEAQGEYDRYHPYNQAVKDIVNHYRTVLNNTNIHCLDLLANADKYDIDSLKNDFWYSHYTAIGYEQFAEILNDILSEYINNHISEFRDVAFIEYDE